MPRLPSVRVLVFIGLPDTESGSLRRSPNRHVEGKAVTCREQETSNKSKDKIRNTQRREIVGTDIRELSPKANFDL
jgi:hypothetical protein